MKRNEAISLIGKYVSTYYRGGVYVGKLLNITESKPFRANVQVSFIKEYPIQFNHNAKGGFLTNNTPCKFNDIINVGSDIIQYDDDILDYKYSAFSSLNEYINKVNKHIDIINNEGMSCYIYSIENGYKLINILSKHKEMFYDEGEG